MRFPLSLFLTCLTALFALVIHNVLQFCTKYNRIIPTTDRVQLATLDDLFTLLASKTWFGVNFVFFNF